MEKEGTEKNLIFDKKYHLKTKLKSGGFGSVYLALDLSDKNKRVAVKVMKSDVKQYAEAEFKMYKKIEQNKYTHGFTKHYQHGLENDKYYLAMELLDRDLEDLVAKQKNRKFTLKTVLMVGLQIVDRIEAIHKIGYVHRDIKPDNLVIGFEENNKVIYLIDFGLAKKIQEIRPEEKGKMLGSLAYMSCRSHEGKLVGPSDDLESLIYSLIFLLTGSLPWMKLQIKKISDAHKILVMKSKLSEKDFKPNEVPSEFFDILKLLRGMKQAQVPDYLKIKFKFLEILKKNKCENDFCFDWSKQKTLSPRKMEQKDLSPEKIKQQKMKQQNQKIVQKEIYEVYKFLDTDSEKQNAESQIAAKKQLPKRGQTAKKRIDNTRENSNSKKAPLSAHKQKRKPTNSANNTILDKIAMINMMHYEGPNIMINKTAKHKI